MEIARAKIRSANAFFIVSYLWSVQFKVKAPMVIGEAVILQIFRFKVFVVNHGNSVTIPVVSGCHPTVPVGSPLNPSFTTSVDSAPVAVTGVTVAQDPEEIVGVPVEIVPLAIVSVVPHGAPAF